MGKKVAPPSPRPPPVTDDLARKIAHAREQSKDFPYPWGLVIVPSHDKVASYPVLEAGTALPRYLGALGLKHYYYLPGGCGVIWALEL